MRQNYIYLFFLFLFTTLSFAQKVTITPTAVNGSNVNAGPINLASVPYSTISLSVKVEIPAGAAIGDQGTITIYYLNSVALGANIATGGNGGALYFGGGKVATRSFTINLSWGDFQTSGGFIYAEYKNSNSASAAAFKSSYLSVIKNPTMTSGTTVNPPADAPNPTKIPNTLCCNQTVRLGEKPAPITGTTYLNPYQNMAYGIKSSWTANGLGSVRFISNDRSTLNIDHMTELGKFTVTRGIAYNYDSQYPNKSNAVTITVVPSPMISNEISINASVDGDGFAEIMNTNPKDIIGQISSINLSKLQDPYYTPKRGDISANIEKYEWEYSKKSGPSEGANDWISIPNENQISLSINTLPDVSTLKDNFYLVRRIAIYQNIRSASNALKIVIRTIRNNNTICCDQALKILSENETEKPTLIIGSDAISSKNQSLLYQWQNQVTNDRQNPIGNWTNIKGATSKDYQPEALQSITVTNGRISTTQIPTYNYRRIAQTSYYNGGEISYSNEVRLTPSYGDTSTSPSLIKIYPNPATSILNIENTNTNPRTYGISNFDNIHITIVNILGVPVPSNFSIINPNLITVNVSDLTPGTYFINIESNTVNNRSGGYNEKFTFIKSN
ncbi:putative secreted protein (Por secretion system target) [Flavobacterium sp. 90]|uniref:T9SS type A sorting domain-containing protein n=1 Tax=unclassified Flavobacterium TaxID=196869 RepID=UPI000EABC223|nr:MULTISPECIES: T9SS type A sorting domain-containing protein [unclassified Flavobacterium]RKR08568.1 putative secreted protein (Por secretion system target) [Flavobacterium sp. 81]TCK52359.1 putative secreted protein (Por secretion system target) [Flavobacterium sp. 90]